MKTEFTEVSPTRKHLSFEVPPEVVEAEISRVAQGYSKSARVPGFRQGKVPATVVRQRYKDQILNDVAHELIPRLVGAALRERGLDPVATPDVRDVVIEEGKPLTFLADFETLPPIELGDYAGLSLRKPPAVLERPGCELALLARDIPDLEPAREYRHAERSGGRVREPPSADPGGARADVQRSGSTDGCARGAGPRDSQRIAHD